MKSSVTVPDLHNILFIPFFLPVESFCTGTILWYVKRIQFFFFLNFHLEFVG